MANANPAYYLSRVPGGAAYQSRCRQVATFNGVSQYVEHPSTTPINITLDVKPASGGNTGLPTGCPALADGIRQQVSFAFAGALTEIGRNGASYFNGDIYSVSYDSSEFYPLDDGYANNPVVRNAAASLGVNTWDAGNAVADGTETSFETIVSNPDSVNVDAQYLVEYTVSGITSGNMQFRLGTESGNLVSSNGVFKEIVTAKANSGTVTGVVVRAGNSPPNNGATISNISIRQADGYGQLINGTEATWSERCDL